MGYPRAMARLRRMLMGGKLASRIALGRAIFKAIRRDSHFNIEIDVYCVYCIRWRPDQLVYALFNNV